MRASLLAPCLLLLLPFPAAASTYTYTYTGNPYQMVQGDYTRHEFITASFTLTAPLAPNLTSFTGVSGPFSAFDGYETISNTTPNSFGGISVETNAAGAIDFWIIDVTWDRLDPPDFDIHSVTINEILSSNPQPGTRLFPQDYAYYGLAHNGYDGQALNEDEPGTWALTISGDPATPTPEPATLALAASGLALANTLRRRRASPHPR